MGGNSLVNVSTLNAIAGFFTSSVTIRNSNPGERVLWVSSGSADSQVLLSVYSSGAVGVGISEPRARLHISSQGAGVNDELLLVSSGPASGQELFGVSGNGEVGMVRGLAIGRAYAGDNHPPSGGLIVEGGVGIGTHTLSGNTKFEVKGDPGSGNYAVKFYSGENLIGGMRAK
jgi:hypothetical protein